MRLHSLLASGSRQIWDTAETTLPSVYRYHWPFILKLPDILNNSVWMESVFALKLTFLRGWRSLCTVLSILRRFRDNCERLLVSSLRLYKLQSDYRTLVRGLKLKSRRAKLIELLTSFIASNHESHSLKMFYPGFPRQGRETVFFMLL